MVSDRDLLMGLFSAIGALARRLTGERLYVRFKCGEDEYVWSFASEMGTVWVKNPPGMANTAEDGSQLADLLGTLNMLAQRRNEGCATVLTDQQSVAQLAID